VGEISARLEVTGMHCHSCAMMVDMAVGELGGVSDSHTEYSTGESVVAYDDEVVTLQEIVDAIRSAGYDARPSG